jgi:hypothetical protein
MHSESDERLFGTCAHEGCSPLDIPPVSKTVGHKNPSFFTAGRELLFLDWIAPMEVWAII